MKRLEGDALLVRAASRRIAIQATVVMALTMLLLVATVTVLVVHSEQVATDRSLRSAITTVDDVADPPPGSWIVIASPSAIKSSPGIPAAVRQTLSALRAKSTTRSSLRTFTTADDNRYRAITRTFGELIVQLVVDLRPQTADREVLFRTMAIAALLAMGAAGGAGFAIGRRAVRPLAQALALQRAFVADASHELRTPLTLLSTRAQVLDRDLRSGTVTKQTLSDSAGVTTDIKRMVELVEDLLAAADPRADGSHQGINASQVAEAVVESASAYAATRNVTLSLTIEEKAAGLSVAPSQAALRRALLSLVDNAIDHTPAQGSVRVEVSRTRNDVVIAVSDTGPGISPSQVKDLTQRFRSGGQRAGRAHYGLGLALTHDLANRHAGQLTLAPTEVGTRFELSFPAQH